MMCKIWKYITELNIDIKEIHKLINAWNGRNITPLEKVTLMKSLLIFKITHILLSLPTPKDETLEKLDILFRDFIWNSKPLKIRREILETIHNFIGLKMTNLRTFDQSLKISWLRRLIDHSDGWEELPRKFNVNNIPLFGCNYPKVLLKNHFGGMLYWPVKYYKQNSFWTIMEPYLKMLN